MRGKTVEEMRRNNGGGEGGGGERRLAQGVTNTSGVFLQPR